VVQNALLQNALLGLGEADLEGKENVKLYFTAKRKRKCDNIFSKRTFFKSLYYISILLIFCIEKATSNR
jgi:hypothetical protein